MDNKITTLSRKLRKNMTEAERKLWSRLRNKKLIRLKFRRQQPIGHYIVDFVCFEKKLIIEIDGGQHAIDKEKDVARDEWLNDQGFTVLRFWNNDVLKNCSGVLEEIMRKYITTSPSLKFLPSRLAGGKLKVVLYVLCVCAYIDIYRGNLLFLQKYHLPLYGGGLGWGIRNCEKIYHDITLP